MSSVYITSIDHDESVNDQSDQHEIDANSQYQIAKKKELLIKKINQLRVRDDSEELTRTLIN